MASVLSDGGGGWQSLLSFVLTISRLTDTFDIYAIGGTKLHVFMKHRYLEAMEYVWGMSATSLGFFQTVGGSVYRGNITLFQKF